MSIFLINLNLNRSTIYIKLLSNRCMPQYRTYLCFVICMLNQFVRILGVIKLNAFYHCIPNYPHFLESQTFCREIKKMIVRWVKQDNKFIWYNFYLGSLYIYTAFKTRTINRIIKFFRNISSIHHQKPFRFSRFSHIFFCIF